MDTLEKLKPILASSLKQWLIRDTVPKNVKHKDCDIQVPASKTVFEDNNVAVSTVTYVLRWPDEKKHTLNVRYKFNKAGEVRRETIQYV